MGFCRMGCQLSRRCVARPMPPDDFAVSLAALAAAAFNHLYIWVHFYFTELPDIRFIYGEPAKQGDV